MNERVNRFNNITVLGKERAERTIFRVLGGCCLEDVKILAKDEGISRAKAAEMLNTDSTFDSYNPNDFFYIMMDCMAVVGRVYCDKDYDDKKLDKDLLFIKQKFEHLKARTSIK